MIAMALPTPSRVRVTADDPKARAAMTALRKLMTTAAAEAPLLPESGPHKSWRRPEPFQLIAPQTGD